jgi:rare lipoprotein A
MEKTNVSLLVTLRIALWGVLVLWSGLFIDVFVIGSDASARPALTRMGALPASSAQPVGYTETGLASVYADAHNGHVTASGQIYDRAKLTTAHKTLPYGTKVKVTNPKNHQSVILLVNDRGPVQAGRILDISPAAASHLGFRGGGVHQVTLEVVEVGTGKTTRPAHH